MDMDTHLKLDAQGLGPEQMDHPRDPPLFLGRVLLFHHIRTLSSYLFHVFHRGPTDGVGLIFDEHVTQVQDAVHVARGLDHGFVLEYARDDAVCNGASGGKELLGEKRYVTRDGEQGQDGLVRVDGGDEQRCQVGSGLRGVELWAIAHSATIRCMRGKPHLSAYSLILLCANPKIWSTYSSLSG